MRAFGEPDNAPPRRALSSNPLLNAVGVLGRASHSRDFWIVAGTFFICGATTNGFIGTHFIALCGDAQIPQITSASLLAAIGVFSMIGSTASGMLSDSFASRWMLFTVYGLRGLSLFALPFALVGPASSIVLPVFVVFYGLDWLATGGPNLRALAEALGKEDAPVAFGWIGVFHQVGAGMTAFLAGAIRTELGTYGPAFAITGALCMIAALASLGIGWRGTPTRRLATA